MAKDDDPATFDVDAIQAQIDLAMSITEDIVSGWFKPSAPGPKSNQARKKAFEETERELEAYMRRPPRLGVGAPVPDAGGPSTREAMTLRNKIAGPSKNRDAVKDFSSSAALDGVADENDEEAETKGSSGHHSISKRTRVDPFSTPKKKPKQLSQSMPLQQPSIMLTHNAVASVDDIAVADARTGKVETLPEVPRAPQENGATPATLISETKKKKKKKKKRKREELDESDSAQRSSVSEKPSLSVDFSSMRTNGALLSPSPSTSRTSTFDGTNSTDSSVEYDENEEWMGFSIPFVGGNEAAQCTLEVLQSNLPSIPLLNLNGPPPDEDDENGADRTPKPKKARRRKKRQAIEQGTEP